MRELWTRAQTELALHLRAEDYAAWFKPARLAELSDQAAVVEVPDPNVADYLAEKCTTLATRVVSSLAGRELTVAFRVREAS